MGETPRQRIEASSLKPMCMRCMRRVYGIGKGDGWWCTHCDEWIVKARKPRKLVKS